MTKLYTSSLTRLYSSSSSV